MKLAAIFNVWMDSIELLGRAIECMPAEEIIIVWSEYSNRGERATPYLYIYGQKVHFVQCEPKSYNNPADSETRKRNAGLHKAKELGCTHFIMCDSDEFYIREEFEETKKLFDSTCIYGVVHPVRVYVGRPTLWCDDHTLVPGIQRLFDDSEVGFFQRYPFAYDREGNAHIDPTRRPNTDIGIDKSPFFMHHMSYVRQNIDLKIRNSSANLRRSEAAIKRDIANAAPGYMSELYHRELKESENLFGITI